jgi:hypothetical protein
MGAEVQARRRRVARALRDAKPIDADDMGMAIEVAKEQVAKLKSAYLTGTAMTLIVATMLWHLYPWAPGDTAILVAAVVAFGIYLVGIVYGLRVQRWLKNNS